jgi:hypothetical protein
MEIKTTDQHTQEFEKDFGEDDDGRPMIGMLRFQHRTVVSDEDLRPQIVETRSSWYNCYRHPEEGSSLETALRKEFFDGKRLPILSGIRSISDDGREIEFCWR